VTVGHTTEQESTLQGNILSISLISDPEVRLAGISWKTSPTRQGCNRESERGEGVSLSGKTTHIAKTVNQWVTSSTTLKGGLLTGSNSAVRIAVKSVSYERWQSSKTLLKAYRVPLTSLTRRRGRRPLMVHGTM